MKMNKTLLLGGARSGKSELAEMLCIASGYQPVYLATATITDSQFAERINKHKARRGQSWILVEETIEIASVISSAQSKQIILIDCLTLWLSNLIHHEKDFECYLQELCNAIALCKAHLVFVSSEVGWGIHPQTAIGRTFRDKAGYMHQAVARLCANVALVVAGLPMMLKGQLPPYD